MSQQDYENALVEEWKIQHGTTPVDWNAIYNAQGMERGGINTYTSAKSESRPVNQLRVDVPWGAGRGPQYPDWLTNGLYGGNGGGSSLSPEQAGTWQKNFYNSVTSGNWYDPQSMSNFGPQGWYNRTDYDSANPAEIPQGSWLWNMPSAYRSMYQATTPEIQSLMTNALIPDYNRRQDYSTTPGMSRWMR